MGIIRKCTSGRVYVEHLEEWLENSKSSVNFSSLHLTKLDAHLPCPHDRFFPHTLALTLWCFHFIIPSLISSPSLSSLYPRVNRCICYGMGPFIPFLSHHPTISFCNSSGWVYFSGCLAPMFPALIQPTWLYLFIFPEWNPKHDVFLFKILSVATAKWINFSLQHSRLWVSIYLSQYFSNLANLMYILLYYIPYIQDFVHTIFFYWNVLPSSLPLKILTFSLDKSQISPSLQCTFQSL